MKTSILSLLVLSCACSIPETRRGVHLSTDSASTSPDLRRVSIRLTVADMPRAAAEELLGAGGSSGSDFGPEMSRRLEDLARADAGVEIEYQSLLVLLDAQRGDVAVGNSMSYVRDFEVDADRGIADPVIEELWEGLRFEAQPEIRADGAGVDVDFSLDLTTLERPILESTVQLPLGEPVTIQKPVWTKLSESRRITSRPGRVFAFVLEPKLGEKKMGRTRVVTLGIDLPEGTERVSAHTEDCIEFTPR